MTDHSTDGAELFGKPRFRRPNRFRVDPRDVPATAAARRLGLTAPEFNAKLLALYTRGFPRPDPTTGRFDLKAIDEWMDNRHKPPSLHSLLGGHSRPPSGK